MFDLNPSGEPLASEMPVPADASSPQRLRCVCGTCADCQSKSPAAVTPTELASLDSLPASASSAAPTRNTRPLHDDAGQEASNRPTSANHAANTSQPTNPIAPPSNSAQCSLSLEDVFSRTRDDVHESRYASHRMALRRFKAFAGAISVLDITDACAGAFVESLRSRQLSEATVLRQLLVLSSVVLRGQRAGLLPRTSSDPFERDSSRLWPRREQRTEVQTFSIDELQRLVLLAARPERGAVRNALRSEVLWTLLLCLFTGIRIRELLSLGVSDVVLEDGCWGLQIFSRPGYTRNGCETRFVPLHRELLKCGFLKYVALRKEAHQWLLVGSSLSELHYSAVPSARSRRFARLVDASGVMKLGRGFPALRQTFQAACIRSGMRLEVLNYLCGSSASGVRAVSRLWRPPAQTLSEMMAAVEFDSLDLSGLYIANPVS